MQINLSTTSSKGAMRALVARNINLNTLILYELIYNFKSQRSIVQFECCCDIKTGKKEEEI